MTEKTYAGMTVEINEEGYMTDYLKWTKEIAIEIAKEEKIVLTDQHFAIMEFLRKRFTNNEIISIRSINHSGIIDVKTFYQLFPGAPMKKATRIAGLTKPSNCI
jgi:TusE/DsrC/DsvC family sulfur relay protein